MMITVLADNIVTGYSVRGEHGLAFWIDTGINRIMFDTGQGLVLADNAHVMGVNLGIVDNIVLSHGHYDHTGGLPVVLHEAVAPVMVYAHPDVFQPRYKKDPDGNVRDISMPVAARDAFITNQNKLILSRTPVQIVYGVWMTGEIPRQHSEETITESFCTDQQGRLSDALLDDQALFIENSHGTVVLLGCAHSGVINTLDYIMQITGGRPVYAVIGGMHLGTATPERLDWTFRELQRFEVKLLVPHHCTGQEASAALWMTFPGACRRGGVGTKFEF